MSCTYKSIFQGELASFLEFINLSKVDCKPYQRTLSSLDAFLHEEKLSEKRIVAEQIKRWLDGLSIELSSKRGKLSHVRRFAKYLTTLGIPVNLPELPRRTKDFKPYVFTSDEMTQIFEFTDDFILANPKSRVIAEFPMLLRILYGCGLRLGEATSLLWSDVDLSTGVLTITAAKNQKQRIVPMGDELTRILGLYKKSHCFTEQDQGPLFRKENGQPRTKGAYWSIFNRILCSLGIKNPQNAKHRQRGPCIHSLRHTFTMQSFIKADSEGRGFMETVPFLSTYLGHYGLMQTDVYLKARHELYTQAHAVVADYTCDMFPEEV